MINPLGVMILGFAIGIGLLAPMIYILIDRWVIQPRRRRRS